MPHYKYSPTSEQAEIFGPNVIIASGTLSDADRAKLDNTPTDTNTELASKVDTVSGKALSTNDFDNTYKSKLDNAPTDTNTELGLKANTSDVNTSLSSKADLVGGLVPSNQLPSSVDEILEYANLASFPVTGEVNKIYLVLDTNKSTDGPVLNMLRFQQV